MVNPKYVTASQANWFAKVREGIEDETGKSFAEWVIIARACPETTHKKRLLWFKENHNLGVNRASTILSAAFEEGLGWDNPEELLNRLWKIPETREIYDEIETYTKSLGSDVIVGPRKTFSGFSRKYQFAAARPVRGRVRLGLSLDPQEYGLEPRNKSDSWSERLRSVLVVSAPKEIDDVVKAHIKSAWHVS